jgi:hypothetical protein
MPEFAPVIQKYIYNKTGYDIKFDNFYFSPFSLTLVNFRINDMVVTHKVTFKINPFKFLIRDTSPVNYISKINISKLKIYLNKNTKFTDSDVFASSKNEKSFIEFLKSTIRIYADELIVSKNIDSAELVKIINTNMLISHDKITLDTTVHTADLSMKLHSQINRISDVFFNTSSFLTAKQNKTDIYINSEGTIDLSFLRIVQNISVKKLRYHGLNFDCSYCSFLKIDKSYNISLTGKFGSFELSRSSDSITRVMSKIDVSKINENISGNVKLDFKGQDNTHNLELNISNLIVFGIRTGNFRLFGKKKYNIPHFFYMYDEFGNRIEVIYECGAYEGKFIVRNKKIIGTVKGNIKTGEIYVNANNVNIADFSIPFICRNIKGIANISGAINKVSRQINFTFKGLSLLGIYNANISGAFVIQSNDMYVFNLYSDDNSIMFNAVVKNWEILSIDFKFIGADVSSIFRVCGKLKDNNISGIANAYVKYEKKFGTNVDLKVFDGILYGTKFKKLEVKGNVNLNRINIERFAISNNCNEIIANVTGLLGFTDKNPVSFLYIDVKNISVRDVPINGYMKFHGYLNDNGCIKGTVRGTGMMVSGLLLGDISSDIIVSNKKIEISNLKSDNGIEGSILANFKENKLSGSVNFRNTNIRGIYHCVSGFLNSSIKLSGKLTNPNIDISASIIKGQYLSIPFSVISELKYENRKIIVNSVMISSDKSSIRLHGKYFEGVDLFLTINNLNEKIIGAFAKFKIPLQGNFSGTGILSIRNSKYNCKLGLVAKTVYIKAVKVNNVKFSIEINNDAIIISRASGKISDSEIRIDNGIFDIKDAKYEFNLFLVNVHAGLADLFGSVKLSGIMTREKENCFIYSGAINLNNLWINRYKLSSYCIDYTVKNRTLEFSQKVDDLNISNFSGLIVFNDFILVEKFNILKDKTSSNLSVDFSRDPFNLTIKSTNLNWSVVTNILNLPNSIDGDVDINVNLSGDIDNPKGNISVFSTSGFLMDIPYDSFNVEINFYDNCAHIIKAAVFKQNEMDISIYGDFPFCFNKILLEKINKQPINISYSINDYKLNILKYLSVGFIKPFAGKLVFSGSFTGTYEKINSNGKFYILGGAFESNDYFNKVKNISVELSLIENLVKVDKFNFKSGLGKLNIYGQLKLGNFNINGLDIRIVTNNKGLPLRIPQLAIPSFMGSKSFIQDVTFGEPILDIKIEATQSKPKISGSVILKNTRFTFPGKVKNGYSFLSNLSKNAEFDLKFIAAKNTRFENSYISALIDGFLHIKGHYNNIKPYGVIESLNGRMYYLGMVLNISSAVLEVIDNEQIYITASGETAITSKAWHSHEVIKLSVKRAKLSELLTSGSIKFVSSNNMAINMRENFKKASETEQGFIMKQQVFRLLDQTLTTPLTKIILRKTGFVDDFRVSYVCVDNYLHVDKNTSLANFLLGTKYSFEKNLTNRILLGYSITFNEFNIDEVNKKLYLRHGISVKYKLSNSLYLDGSFELNSEKKTYHPEKRLMFQYQFKFAPAIKKVNTMQ